MTANTLTCMYKIVCIVIYCIPMCIEIDFIALYIGSSVTKDGELKSQLLCCRSNFSSMAPVLSSAPTIKVGHIDDVQELTKTRPTSVPERYVRDATERPVLATIPTSMNIPIIDMSKLAHGSEDQSWGEMVKLAAACEEWGFFQVMLDFLYHLEPS